MRKARHHLARVRVRVRVRVGVRVRVRARVRDVVCKRALDKLEARLEWERGAG